MYNQLIRMDNVWLNIILTEIQPKVFLLCRCREQTRLDSIKLQYVSISLMLALK